MRVIVAVDSISKDLPRWFSNEYSGMDSHRIENARTVKRRKEILWSRGLLSEVKKQFDVSCTANSKFLSSISHSGELVAIAATLNLKIGIDLQFARPEETYRRIAKTWFPFEERQEINSSDNPNQFLYSWVVKEAWAKCVGCSIFDACSRVYLLNNQVHIGTDQGALSFWLADLDQSCFELHDNCNVKIKTARCVAALCLQDPDCESSDIDIIIESQTTSETSIFQNLPLKWSRLNVKTIPSFRL